MESLDEPLLDSRPEIPQKNNSEFEDLEFGNSAFLIDTTSSFESQNKSGLMPSNIFDDL
jgi:hypothetical protein